MNRKELVDALAAKTDSTKADAERAVGAAENEAAACIYHEEDFFGGVTASSFRFGALVR